MLNGNRIDAADSAEITINRTAIYPLPATVNFERGYCLNYGKATITKLSDTQIEWVITEKPNGQYYIPNRDTFTKQ